MQILVAHDANSAFKPLDSDCLKLHKNTRNPIISGDIFQTLCAKKRLNKIWGEGGAVRSRLYVVIVKMSYSLMNVCYHWVNSPSQTLGICKFG